VKPAPFATLAAPAGRNPAGVFALGTRMSIFDRLDQSTSRAVDRVNAIDFKLVPMTATPNGRREPDSSPPVITDRGILDYVDGDAPLEVGNRDRRGNDLRTLLNDPRPILSIDRSYFPTVASEPRQGDRIEFPGGRILQRWKWPA
jgi:hypothetical protein